MISSFFMLPLLILALLLLVVAGITGIKAGSKEGGKEVIKRFIYI
jgi:hypothetical protein